MVVSGAVPAGATRGSATRRWRRRAPRGLTLLCAAFLLTGAAAARAGDPGGAKPASPDTEFDRLLLKIEQQIGEEHTILPDADNAMSTWQGVISRSSTASAATLSALAEFASRAQRRATEESAVGHARTAIDFAVFASLANDLLAKADRNTAAAAGDPPEHAAQADQTLQPAPAAITAPVVAPSSLSFNRATAAPLPPQPAPPQATATAFTAGRAAPVGAPAPASHAPDPSLADQYARRGDEMLAIKDISAARLLYQYAAAAGSARAADALARTFDPAVLPTLGVVGLRPDPAQAATWYNKAAALGDTDAATRLRRLTTQAAK